MPKSNKHRKDGSVGKPLQLGCQVCSSTNKVRECKVAGKKKAMLCEKCAMESFSMDMAEQKKEQAEKAAALQKKMLQVKTIAQEQSGTAPMFKLRPPHQTPKV